MPSMSSPLASGRTRRPFEAVLVFLFAVGVAWHFGHRGFMPLDHSVVFDGGWRILGGQVPWRDFDAPSFVTPSYLQALFFGLFGVSWSSFVAHAALANGVFALCTWSLVVRLGGQRWVAAGAAGLAALLFYPPVGVPFADQHSFLFTLLALWAAVVGRGLGGAPQDAHPDEPGGSLFAGLSPSALIAWIVVPLFVLAGFFSKQLPTALAPALIAVVVLAPAPRPRRAALVGLAAGLLLALVAAGLFLVTTGVEASHVAYCLFELPLAEAEVRRAYMPKGLALVGRVLGAGASAGPLPMAWLGHLAFLGLAVLAFLGLRPGAGPRGADGSPSTLGLVLASLALGEGLLLLGQVTMVLANNQDAAAVGFVIPALALLFAGASTLARAATGPAQRIAQGVAAALLLLVLAEPTFWLADLTGRATNDLAFDPEVAELVTAEASPVLAGLWHQQPEHHAYPLAELLALADDLAARDGDFLLVGDTALLFALTGKRSTLPSLWFHPGVTIPMKGTPGFRAWQDLLVAEIEAGTLSRIVEERAGTWIGNWTLASLPRVQRAVRTRGFTEEDHGAFRVLELAPR